VVDLSSDTTARCTECNDYHRLIDATVNSVAVAGNCYRMCSFIVNVHTCTSASVALLLPSPAVLSLNTGSLLYASHSLHFVESIRPLSFTILNQFLKLGLVIIC